MSVATSLTDPQFDALRAAVTLARNEPIQSSQVLRARLLASGYPQADIDAALVHWAQHARDARSRRTRVD